MNKPVRADLNHFIKQLVQALKPLAKAEAIDLAFSPVSGPVDAVFHPAWVAADIVHIINKLIEFVLEGERITVSIHPTKGSKCRVTIVNTGINLMWNTEVVSKCQTPVEVVSNKKDTTTFTLEVDLFEEEEKVPVGIDQPNFTFRSGQPGSVNFLPDYYAEIRKRLRSHFNKSDNLVDALSRSNPREAAFLAKVNEVILANLENRQLDANYLSGAMHMSRTQLFRRLKPIIRQSPGSYIRTIKLQKAKELFETTDMRISEVAYKTGFETASHFTRVFTRQYGVKPSLFAGEKPRQQVNNHGSTKEEQGIYYKVFQRYQWRREDPRVTRTVQRRRGPGEQHSF